MRLHASVKYTKVLSAGSDKFPTKEVVRGVQAAAAGGPPSTQRWGVEYHSHVIWVTAEADSLCWCVPT